MHEPTRVIVADDHAIVREGLRRMLSDEQDIEVVAVAADGDAALREVQALQPDCLLLDLTLPKIPGIEVLRRVRRKWPRLPVVVLSQYPEDFLALHLLAIGASGYLNKQRDPDLILKAIRMAVRGEVFKSDRLVHLERNTLHDTRRVPHETLTPREYQVFVLVLEGLPTSQVAATLDLGVSTVSNYIAAIRHKLSADSVTDIVHYAHRVGLVS